MFSFLQFADVIAAHASHADAGNVQLLARGRRIAAGQNMPRQHGHGGRSQGCAAQKARRVVRDGFFPGRQSGVIMSGPRSARGKVVGTISFIIT